MESCALIQQFTWSWLGGGGGGGGVSSKSTWKKNLRSVHIMFHL